MKSSAGRSEPLPEVHLYEDPSAKTLDLREIADYLRSKFGKISVDVRPPIFNVEAAAEQIARDLAATKVRDPMNQKDEMGPLPGEVEFERRLLLDSSLKLPGVLYDGFRLETAARKLLPAEELDTEHAHIVFTNRLFGTWDDGDRRYHARVSVYGFPSLISTTGIVEAPAKPKEYYTMKRRYMALGMLVSFEELKEKFRGRFIDYDDPRLTEVMKGYAMQALVYHMGFEPFCQDNQCRLYNSHWQEELISAQLGPKGSEFCEIHGRMLEELKV
jgi:hypothetical protein